MKAPDLYQGRTRGEFGPFVLREEQLRARRVTLTLDEKDAILLWPADSRDLWHSYVADLTERAGVARIVSPGERTWVLERIWARAYLLVLGAHQLEHHTPAAPSVDADPARRERAWVAPCRNCGSRACKCLRRAA